MVAQPAPLPHLMYEERWRWGEELSSVCPPVGSMEASQRKWARSPASKHGWWPGGDWKHGDPFPIPEVAVEGFPIGASRREQQRATVRTRRQRMANEALRALNQLSAARANDGMRRVTPFPGQRRCVREIAKLD